MRLISANFLLPSDHRRLDEFNEWYSTRHVEQFLRAPGVVSGRRFWRPVHEDVHFMALYEHDGSLPVGATFDSPEGRSVAHDFTDWFPEMSMPQVQVFEEIDVGPGYRSWR